MVPLNIASQVLVVFDYFDAIPSSYVYGFEEIGYQLELDVMVDFISLEEPRGQLLVGTLFFYSLLHLVPLFFHKLYVGFDVLLSERDGDFGVIHPRSIQFFKFQSLDYISIIG